jgi:hypothetical protein
LNVIEKQEKAMKTSPAKSVAWISPASKLKENPANSAA